VSNKIQWFSAVRVLGLMMVLVYHFFHELLPGGFLGVDLFFTFSGYLITALAVAEFRKSGRFSLSAFGKRRFLRTAPPLLLSVLFTLPFALLVSPDFTANIAKQLASVLGFVSNFFEIHTGGSYEANVLPHLYLHTWTLSMEVHLYIVWGLVCAALALLLRRAYKKSAEKAQHGFQLGICIVSVIAAAGSYIAMQRAYQPGADSSAAYFSSVSHSFPFFIGAAAATAAGLKLGPRAQRFLQKKPAKVLCAAGMLLSMSGIVALALRLQFNDEFVYRFGFLAASLLAACAIVCARALHEALPGKHEPKVLTVLADLSYNIYLYHWPLYIVFSALIRNNALVSLAAFALSLVFSALVFYGVEPLLVPPKKADGPAEHINYTRKKKRTTVTPLPVLAGAMIIGEALTRLRRKRRRWRTIAIAVPVLACISVCGAVIQRAPGLTGIEEKLYAGYFMQDRDAIVARKDWLDSINETPVRFNGEISALPVLSENGSPPERQPGVIALSPIEVGGGVTILGDSISVDARLALIESIPNCAVDALSSRSIAEGYNLMMEMQQKGTLREVVVIALGTNGVDDFADYVQKIIDDIAEGHRLVFVVPFDGRTPDYGRAYRTAMLEREIAPQYEFVTLADWRAAIDTQTKLLASDTVHLGTNESRRIYVGVITEAVRAAAHGPAKGDIV